MQHMHQGTKETRPAIMLLYKFSSVDCGTKCSQQSWKSVKHTNMPIFGQVLEKHSQHGKLQ